MVMLTATEILAIAPDEPERLFAAPDAVADRYRQLALRWHPDRPGGDIQVFEHIAALKRAAEQRVRAGLWQAPGILDLAGRRLRYFKRDAFELGTVYLGNSVLAYVVEPDFRPLALRAEAAIANLTFANADMAAQMAPRLPRLKTAFDTDRGQRVLVLEKAVGLIRLSDLLAANAGVSDPRHVAWLISDLLNIACYLGGFSALSLVGLTPETVFVDARAHRVALLGGWFYATPLGAPFLAVPEWPCAHLPAVAENTGRASGAVDLALIRAIGRAALGAAEPVPAALRYWLDQPSDDDPIAEYRHWPDVLADSFGRRRFIELPVTARDIYGKDAENG